MTILMNSFFNKKNNGLIHYMFYKINGGAGGI